MRDAFKDESNIDEFETKVEIVYIKEELLPSFVKDDRCTLEDTFIEDTFYCRGYRNRRYTLNFKFF